MGHYLFDCLIANSVVATCKKEPSKENTTNGINIMLTESAECLIKKECNQNDFLFKKIHSDAILSFDNVGIYLNNSIKNNLGHIIVLHCNDFPSKKARFQKKQHSMSFILNKYNLPLVCFSNKKSEFIDNMKIEKQKFIANLDNIKISIK